VIGFRRAVAVAEPHRQLEALLTVARLELDRVDHKAEVLFTGSGVITGAIVAGALAGPWSPLVLGSVAQIVWWSGIAAWLAGLGFLAAAVYPRLGSGRRRTAPPMIAYFLDVARLRTREDLHHALRNPPAPSGPVLIDQIFRVSKLVRVKYRCLQAALWLLALSVACGAVLLTFQR
jgi:hypothetical protein